MVNASPFTYSIGLMSYRPLNGGTLAGGAVIRAFSGGGCPYSQVSEQGLMVHTQHPHAYFYPHKSQGCELILPFIYPSPWLNLDSSDLNPLRVMGDLYISSFQPLLNASGTPQASPINVSLYVWASDVQLSGPSMSLQADEYVEGTISAPASSMARVLSSLSWVPVVGPYMRASSVIASSVSNVAKLFGYSNPPVISPVQAVIVKPCVNLSSPMISTQIEKISLDPKNELAVSGVSCGTGNTDDMSFYNIQNRDVFINKSTWLTTDSYDTPIFSSYVTPVQYFTAQETVSPFVYVASQMTPGALLAQNFEFWRGDITYTFKIAASAFHRGRLRILYDPNGPSAVSPYNVPRVHQHIWDLSESDTFVLNIPFMAPTQWLECSDQPLNGPSTYSLSASRQATPTPTYVPAWYNGYIQISVLNELTSAAGGLSTIVVTMNTKNVEYSSPKKMVDYQQVMMSKVDLQSDIVLQSDDVHEIAPVETTTETVTTMGESVRSVRTLIKRAQHWDTVIPSPFPSISPQMADVTVNYDTIVEFIRLKWVFPRFPMPRHIANLVTNSFATGDGSFPWTNYKTGVDTSIFAGSHTKTLPMTLFASCYVGWRGSVVWRAFNDAIVTNGAPYSCDISLQPDHKSWTSVMPYYKGQYSDLRGSNLISMSQGVIEAISSAVMPTSNDAMSFMQKDRVSVIANQENQLFGVAKTMTNYHPQSEAVFPMYTTYLMYPGNMTMYQRILSTGSSLTAYAYGMEAGTFDTISAERTCKSGTNLSGGTTLAALADGTYGSFQLYVSAGDDMSYFMFLGVPTLYRVTGVAVNTGLSPWVAPVAA